MGQGEEETKQKGHFTFCQEPGGEEKKKNKKTTTICLSRMAGWLPWHQGLAVPGEITALLSHSGLRIWLALLWLPALPWSSSEPVAPGEETSTLPP